MRKLPFFIFLALVAVFVLMLLHKATPVDAGNASDAPFPAISVTSMDGGKAWDAKALEGKVTLVNFYASWCAPCAAEMPELVALKKKFSNLQVIGIAWNDDPKTLKNWLKKNGDPFTSHWFDKNGDATIALGIKGIPESFIIDSAGKVRYRLSGPLNPAARESTIDPLLDDLEEKAQALWEINHGL